MKAIRVEAISKSFGRTKAVDNLNLSLEYGEIRGLLGPNGSGKSTAMKIMIGILKPDSGSVNVFGMNVEERLTDVKRVIGYVPEIPHLYEYLTAAEYLDFVGIAYGIKPEIMKDRVEELLNIFQMDEHLHEVMSGFSQGMKQKITLIASLLHKPKLLVMDEPLNGLDPRSARIVKEILNRLANEGIAIIFSTHVLEIAETICHRVTIMNEGCVLAEGSVQELRSLAGMPGSNLEDIFLRLTGNEDTNALIEALKL